ncbi:MAG: hypothetical protein K0Q79_1456 [Flavipsychrobacter sp.]|jgi:hypothetical protein|nr:hypothetical protein [Flavipsychrobacter sp.]
MKRRMLLLTLALPVIVCQNVAAQTASRLIAETGWSNDGVSFLLNDSAHYNYSAGRGGDLTHPLKYDNSTTWSYDTGVYTNQWNYIQRYDVNHNDTSDIAQYWDAGMGVWVPYSNTLKFYNSSNKMTSKILQTWGGSSWVPVARNLYSYDLAGRLIVDQYQVYVMGTYVATSQTTYYYDGVTGNLINHTNQDFVSSTWVYSNAWDYTYTSSNQPLTVTKKMWNGSGWTPETLYTNTYNTSGDMTYRLLQIYQTIDSTWRDDSLHIYSGFVSHMPTSDVVQHNDTGVWHNVMQFSYTYNGFNQMTSSTGISWNIPSSVFEYALNDPRRVYFYETYTPSSTSVKPVLANGGSANVYPVPAQNVLNVDLKWDVAQAASITIFDAQGRVVRQWETPSSTAYASSVSISNLADGLYFISINGTEGKIVKQLVVAH